MFSLKYYQRSRSIRLRVRADGTLLVSAPYGVSLAYIQDFVSSQKEWIESSLKKMPTPSTPRIPAQISLFGTQFFSLNITKVHQKNLKVRKEESVIHIGISPLEQDPDAKIRAVLEQFYEEEAKSHFAHRLEHFSTMLGLPYQKFFVKNQSSRWGSCSQDRNINLNVRLMLAPQDIIDYVIVHELCHLAEMNHSSAFWSLVASVLPNYKILRSWLKKHGHTLIFFSEGIQ